MIRRQVHVYCDNEHGFGDETFPGAGVFSDGWSLKLLREKAAAAGWVRRGMLDYCPGCAEAILAEEAEAKQTKESTRCPATLSLFPEA